MISMSAQHDFVCEHRFMDVFVTRLLCDANVVLCVDATFFLNGRSEWGTKANGEVCAPKQNVINFRSKGRLKVLPPLPFKL